MKLFLVNCWQRVVEWRRRREVWAVHRICGRKVLWRN